MTDAMVQHFDACLGCMACVTACPSGVQYDKLIEATRAQVERRHDRAARRPGAAGGDLRAVPATRAGCGCCAGRCAPTRPAGLDRGAAPQRAARRGSRPGWRRWSDLAPRLSRRERLPERVPAVGHAAGGGRAAHRLRAGRVLPGRQRGDRPGAGRRGLRRRHPARHRAAAARCRCTTAARRRRSASPARTIDTFEAAGVDAVVVNAAGCGSSMKEYAELLADDPAYAERAAGVRRRRCATSPSSSPSSAPVAPRHPLEVTVAYHDACHLAHAQGVRAAAPGAAAGRSPAWSCGRSPRPSCAAARPASTTCSTPSRPASSATARPRNVAATGADAAGDGEPRLPDAGRLRARARRAPASAWRTPSRCSTPRSAASRSSALVTAACSPSLAGPVHAASHSEVRTDVRTGTRPGRRVRSGSRALCAVLPLLTLFVLLGVLRVKAWHRRPGRRSRSRSSSRSWPSGCRWARRCSARPRARRSASSRSCGSSSTRSGSTT